MCKIKICGLRRREDADYVNEARPDFAGVILAQNPKFWRAVSPRRAEELRAALDSAIPLVGVFVDDDPSLIRTLLTSGVIDIAQLHGHEPETVIGELSAATGKPVWKAFQMKTPADVAAAAATSAQRPLLDSGTGSGRTFDWSIVSHVQRPFLLAGGLTPDNLARAIAQTHPWAVDISSGVETERVKDREKILRAVEIAHGMG